MHGMDVSKMKTISYTPNMFIPGIYTAGTMPDCPSNLHMFAWNDTLGCWMQSDGTLWSPTKSRLTETAAGITDASGNYTYTFVNTYTVAPNVQPVINNQANQNQGFRITALSTTSVTVKVEEQAAIAVGLIGLTVRLGVSTNVVGSRVSILVVETQ